MCTHTHTHTHTQLSSAGCLSIHSGQSCVYSKKPTHVGRVCQLLCRHPHICTVKMFSLVTFVCCLVCPQCVCQATIGRPAAHRLNPFSFARFDPRFCPLPTGFGLFFVSWSFAITELASDNYISRWWLVALIGLTHLVWSCRPLDGDPMIFQCQTKTKLHFVLARSHNLVEKFPCCRPVGRNFTIL